MTRGRRISLSFIVGLVVAGGATFVIATLVFGHQGARQLGHVRSTHGGVRAVDVSQAASSSGSSALAVLEGRQGMIMSKATDLGTIGSGTAAVHLLTAPTSRGGSCLVDEGSASVGPGSSCLDTPSLFTLRPVAYLVESSGGPDPANVEYLRVVGVVKPGVDALVVQLSSGANEPVTITSTGAFAYEEPLATIHAGDLASELLVYSGGKVVGTFPLN